jgi:hypothetical protein
MLPEATGSPCVSAQRNRSQRFSIVSQIVLMKLELDIVGQALRALDPSPVARRLIAQHLDGIVALLVATGLSNARGCGSFARDCQKLRRQLDSYQRLLALMEAPFEHPNRRWFGSARSRRIRASARQVPASACDAGAVLDEVPARAPR